jgi:exodeoxyribonuclease-3
LYGVTTLPRAPDCLPRPRSRWTPAGQRLIWRRNNSVRKTARRNEDKRAFQRAVTAALPGFLTQFGGPVIVTGDLNVVEPGHIPHHAVFGDWEYGFYRSFAAAGLTDAYRVLHPDTPGHSWFGRSGHGYRFDHAFVTTPHAGLIRSRRYLQAPRELSITDHAQ